MGQLKAMLFHRWTWNFPLCLTAVHFLHASCDALYLWWPRDTAVGKTLNRWPLGGDASSFFAGSRIPKLRISVSAGEQWTPFEQHTFGMFSDKIHPPPKNEKKLRCPYEMNVHYHTQMYCPWKLCNQYGKKQVTR